MPCQGDERRLRQVLINLAGNAIKFTPSGGSVTLSCAARRRRPGALEVRDTGIGMSAQDLVHVGEPFYQADSKLDRQYEGTGLGLAICQRLVKLHGGSMTSRQRPRRRARPSPSCCPAAMPSSGCFSPLSLSRPSFRLVPEQAAPLTQALARRRMFSAHFRPPRRGLGARTRLEDQSAIEAKQAELRNDALDEAKRLELYRLQVEIRDCEQRAYDLFLQGLVKGTSHLSLGQEAVAAGFAAAMEKGDLSFCTYRGHAHTLARGVPMEQVLGELMQRDNGLMRGKGGSMHLTSVEHGVMGSYAIVGAHLPIACGAAWRAQYKGAEGRLGLLLRRRHHQYRRLPRGAEFRRGVEAAGGVRVREQPLHGIHLDQGRDPGEIEHPAADRAVGLRPRADRDRRQRRRRGLSRRADRLRQGAGGRRAVADRMHDLPL